MNYNNLHTAPVFYELDPAKRIAMANNATRPEYKEFLVHEGAKYKMFVLHNEEKQVEGWRLRDQPIDPAQDYTYLLKDFMFSSDEFGKPPFEACLEEFEKGNKEAAEIIKQTTSKFR